MSEKNKAQKRDWAIRGPSGLAKKTRGKTKDKKVFRLRSQEARPGTKRTGQGKKKLKGVSNPDGKPGMTARFRVRGTTWRNNTSTCKSSQGEQKDKAPRQDQNHKRKKERPPKGLDRKKPKTTWYETREKGGQVNTHSLERRHGNSGGVTPLGVKGDQEVWKKKKFYVSQGGGGTQ